MSSCPPELTTAGQRWRSVRATWPGVRICCALAHRAGCATRLSECAPSVRSVRTDRSGRASRPHAVRTAPAVNQGSAVRGTKTSPPPLPPRSGRRAPCPDAAPRHFSLTTGCKRNEQTADKGGLFRMAPGSRRRCGTVWQRSPSAVVTSPGGTGPFLGRMLLSEQGEIVMTTAVPPTPGRCAPGAVRRGDRELTTGPRPTHHGGQALRESYRGHCRTPFRTHYRRRTPTAARSPWSAQCR